MIDTPSLADFKANPDTAEWLAVLENAPLEVAPVPWPDETEFVARLRYVAIPDDDIAILLGLYPDVTANADLRWIVDRYVRLLRAKMGEPGYAPLPALPDGFGDVGLHLFTFVHAAILPETLAYHRAHGIAEDISQATMADIGRHYVIERTERHRSGLNGGDKWLTFHARGLIYQLGRLQFERAPQGTRSSAGIRAAGIPSQKGDPVLSVHIPGFMGPFPPDAIDAAFAQARAFFPTHFPDERYQIAVCHSWLLDPQLADYLPETSNIVGFQRRFREAYQSDDSGNDDTLLFVFRAPGTALDDLPQRTTLERAAVRHIKDGKTWHLGHGWLELR